MKRDNIIKLLLIVFFVLLFSETKSIHAQDESRPAGGDECLSDIATAFSVETERLRSILFGLQKAEKEPRGAVRRAEDGSVWLKTEDEEWRSDSEGYEDTTWFDTLIDDNAVVDVPRRGIFEMRKVLTSELIHPLLQSARAFQCHTKAVCEVARLSQDPNPPEEEPVEVSSPGCIPLEKMLIPGCRYKTSETNQSDRSSHINVAEASVECDVMRQALLTRELNLLRTVVAYDAAYRSLHQFAGSFDLFLEDFRFSVLSPVIKTANLMRMFDRLPCFLSQCDSPPPLSNPQENEQ